MRLVALRELLSSSTQQLQQRRQRLVLAKSGIFVCLFVCVYDYYLLYEIYFFPKKIGINGKSKKTLRGTVPQLKSNKVNCIHCCQNERFDEKSEISM